LIVYLETNFVIEVAYRQQEVSSCESILGRTNHIDLRVPAVCLCEAHFQYTGRVDRTDETMKKTSVLLGSLKRSKRYAQRADDLDGELGNLVSTTTALDKEHFDMVITRLSEVCRIIGLSPSILKESQSLQTTFGLKPLDSLVAASVLADLSTLQSTSQKIFISRDRKMLADPQLRDRFDAHNCKIFLKFDSADNFITAAL
jgi:hypothetical protein